MENIYGDFDKLKLSFRAGYLISGYINRTLTPDEEEELDIWILADEGNMKLFEDLTDETTMDTFVKWCASRDVERNLSRAKERLVFSSPASKTNSIWKYAAAAAVVGLIALAVFFFTAPMKKGTGGEEIAINNDLLPGSDYALLKLPGGKTVRLDNALDSMVGEGIRVSNGEVVYEKSGTGIDIHQHEIIIPRKAWYKLVLPDGTRVWLNAESSIAYPSAFTGNSRRVSVKGETFFEVAKDIARPFIVEVEGVEVEAVGTAFNINAYSNEEEIRATMVEGLVRVRKKGKEMMLRPGEQLQVSDRIWKKIENVQSASIIAWKDNQFKLRDASIEEIMRQVERWYDATVVYEDNIDYHFNGTIDRNVPLSKLLQLLETTGHVHFKISDHTITVTK